MITNSNIGKHGRLGNQLFQIASLFGIAKKNNVEVAFPKWEYSKYFKNFFEPIEIKGIEVREPYFHYVENWGSLDFNAPLDFFGYFQSEKYWEENEIYIRTLLQFKPEFKAEIRQKFAKALSKQTIAISIRRGDYVNNPNYEQLPITYYIVALQEHFDILNNLDNYNIVIFSDDIPYCKVHFDCLPNVYYSEKNSDIEDICLMSQCDHFIIANSTFSWWGVYLSETKVRNFKSIIIRPNYLFKGQLKERNDSKDFYPERWISFEHKYRDDNNNIGDNRIDLTDTLFTIPVRYDHPDRMENLELTIAMLRKNFDTNIILCEQGGRDFFEYGNNNCNAYLWCTNEKFHRTKMLNIMSLHFNLPIIANWDADVFIAPLQILMTVDKIRKGADMVFPYEWAFARMPRSYYPLLSHSMDIGIVGDTKFNGMNSNDAISVGGAVFFKREAFITGGMENENFISFCPEDVERDIRFRKLGYKVERTLGTLYHLNHWVGVNSTVANPHHKIGLRELELVKGLSKEELLTYIKTWEWIPKTINQ